ncbi:MAG: P-loop NTPase [Bdellovibrionota bacterium]
MSRRRSPKKDSAQQIPLLSEPPSPKILAVASGKGGVGKSFFSASLAWALADTGLRVIAVDADLGGPNLHTCLGVRPPARGGLSALESGRPVEEVLLATPHKRLQLVSSSADPLAVGSGRTGNFFRAISRLLATGTDLLVLDLGAGTSYATVDLFLLAQRGIIVSTAEPTAMENAYRFLKTAFFRFVSLRAPTDRLRQLVNEALQVDDSGSHSSSPAAFLARLSERDAGLARDVEKAIAEREVLFVANQVRASREQELAAAMALAARKVFALPCAPLGSVPYDEAVGRSLRERRPFLEAHPEAPAAKAIRALAVRLSSTERVHFAQGLSVPGGAIS